MKTYQVHCNGTDCGTQYTETAKEAIRFTRMEMFAAGQRVPEGNWWAEEVMV